jgi:PhoH-like ATPase
MHDPAALFRFKEHDVFLPMAVLEELDAAKKGVSEVARNARQVSRILDEIIDHAGLDDIKAGLKLTPQRGNGNGVAPSGRLFLQTNLQSEEIPDGLAGHGPDHSILATTLTLKRGSGARDVTLVSKDINLRIKARLLGITAEDYYSDQVLDDVDLLYAGMAELPPDLWERHGSGLECWQVRGKTCYAAPSLQKDVPLYPNLFLYSEAQADFEVIARADPERGFILEQVTDYRNPRQAVWGITARNREQNFALNLLMDPQVEFVTLLGQAGTGKTLLTLAAGLVQTMETKRYKEIIVTRETVPVGEDIGFLPGTEEEKMTPWMGALMDNLEVLTSSEEGGDWGRAATIDMLNHRIKIRSLNFMRGRTFLNRYIIIDEAQNLTPKQMKTLITRAGSGTKIVCLGNIAQIDTPYLSATTSGLTYAVDRFKSWSHAGHVIMLRGERSRLADFASQNL